MRAGKARSPGMRARFGAKLDRNQYFKPSFLFRSCCDVAIQSLGAKRKSLGANPKTKQRKITALCVCFRFGAVATPKLEERRRKRTALRRCLCIALRSWPSRRLSHTAGGPPRQRPGQHLPGDLAADGFVGQPAFAPPPTVLFHPGRRGDKGVGDGGKIRVG